MIKRSEVLTIIGIVVAIKIILLIWGGAIVFESRISIWDRWDSRIYQTISLHGYEQGELKYSFFQFLSHFPPLYPLLIRSLVSIRLDPFVAGFIITQVFSVASSFLLYIIMKREFKDERKALFAVVSYNLYPTAYFNLSAYAEPLFITLSMAAIYLLGARKEVAAGFLAAGAILSRIIGVVIFPLYIFKIFEERKLTLKTLVSLVVCVLGFLVFVAINLIYFDNPLHFLENVSFNEYSIKKFVFPFSELILKTVELAGSIINWRVSENFMMKTGWGVIFTWFAFIIVLFGTLKRIVPKNYLIYAWSYLIFMASLTGLVSNARFTFAIFPIFMILPNLSKGKQLLFLSVFLGLLLYFSSLFVMGRWAF